MTRTRRRLLVAVLLVALPLAAGAQQATFEANAAKETKIRKLLDLTGAGEIGVQAMKEMVPALKGLVPDAPEAFWEEFMKGVHPEELVAMTVPIYAQHFDESEIDQLIAFYYSPIGRKITRELPAIMSESMAAGQTWGMDLARKALERAQSAGYHPKS